MSSKVLLLTLISLLFVGCKPNTPNHPTNKGFRYSKTSTNEGDIEAILKLDTKGHTSKIKDIIITKEGDIISASDDKTIRIWDSQTGREKRKILGEIGAGAEGMIYAIALSTDNKFLAVGGLLANFNGSNHFGDRKIRIL